MRHRMRGHKLNVCHQSKKHARDGARTHDHKVKSLALYRLSYPGPVVSDVLPSEARLIAPSQHALKPFSAPYIRRLLWMLSHLCALFVLAVKQSSVCW